MKQCFIISPIGDDNSEIRKRSDQLLNHIIQPICHAENFECIRIDQLTQSDSITESILLQLQTADLVIADITDHNPNCFYELGYRAALDKPLIQMKNHSTPIPFDISTIRTIDYDLNDLDKTAATKEKLQETIQSFSFEETTDSAISFCKNPTNEKLDNIQQTLFHISDKIDNMKTDVEKGVISVLADKLQTSNQKSAEQVLIEQIMSLLTNNPDQTKNMITNIKTLEKLNS